MTATLKMNLLKASLLIPTATMACASAMAAPAFVEIGHSVDFLQSAAVSRFAKVDIDGDGLQDLVFLGRSGSPILMAVGKRSDASLGFKMAKVVADDGELARVLSWKSAGIDHVLTVATNGKVRDYSGWPLVEQRNFNVSADVVAAVIGDVDNDGSDDFLVATYDTVNAYSLANGQAEWSYAISGNSDLALAQLDADPALEVILAGPVPGIVLDGATRATDWQYIDGFGARLVTGSLVSGGGTQWVGAPAWAQFTAFQASPWSPLWNGPAAVAVSAIGTANLDNNGQDVILQGDGLFGGVHVIDSNTHLERFQIPHDGYGVSAVVGVDLDGDGKDEIAFATPQVWSDGDALLTIANGQNGLIGWQFFPATGPFIATALGDVDGDGRLELVAASSGYSSYGSIAIFDAETGAEEWHSPTKMFLASDPFYLSVAKIELISHVGNPGMDIVLAGSSVSGGRITVLDGTTHVVRLQIGKQDSEPMMARVLKDLALVDFDSDGVLDYVAAIEPSNTSTSGVLLKVFSGVNGDSLWTSVVMGSGFAQINGVIATDSSAGSSGKELIAVLPDSLRSYDSSTGLLLWTIAASNNGAFLVRSGENGEEIGLFLDNGAVTFYSATTQAYIRSYSLPAPLRAMTALDGDLHTLVAASTDALILVDGMSGSVLAATGYLGQFPSIGSRISAAKSVEDSWMIAAGTEAALYRFHLNPVDVIFANSFETP